MNLMSCEPLSAADCEDFSVFRAGETAWQRRCPRDLRRFVLWEELEDLILDEYADEEQIRHHLDDLPEEEAIPMIEAYVECHRLTDRYDAWMAS